MGAHGTHSGLVGVILLFFLLNSDLLLVLNQVRNLLLVLDRGRFTLGDALSLIVGYLVDLILLGQESTHHLSF